jgi:2,3-bisphosphoglycerate-dependent phosphoglycerate mutase
LSRVCGVKIQLDDDLMEWNNGLIAGLTRQEADEKYPEPKAKHPHTRIYEQESLIDFRMRAETVLSKIITENDESESIAIVSHGKMINMLFRSFVETTNSNKLSLSTSDTGIHHWKIVNNERKIIFCSKNEHINGTVECDKK